MAKNGNDKGAGDTAPTNGGGDDKAAERAIREAQEKSDAENAKLRDEERAAKTTEVVDAARAEQERKNELAESEMIRVESVARAQQAADTELARATVERMRQEFADREKLRPLPPISQSVTAATARPGERCVKMMFPRPMFIWAEPVPDTDNPHLKKRYKVSFGKGVQLVPESLVDTPYLRHCGVQPLEEMRGEGYEPTVEEYVTAGYDARNYKYKRSTQPEIDAAIDRQRAEKSGDAA